MKRIVFISALAAFAATFAASAPKATLGDLGLNAQVVTNVDFSGLSMTETDPEFSTFKNNGGTMYGPLKLWNGIGTYDMSTEISSNGVSFWRFTPSTGGGGIWTNGTFEWGDLLTGETDPNVPAWAKGANKPAYTASEVGATPASHMDDFGNPHGVTCEQIDAAPASITNEMAQMRAENALVYRLYQGSNVVAEVTNFNSTAHAPELRLLQLNESNEYVEVWCETNGLNRTLIAGKEYTDTAIFNATSDLQRTYAPRAWGKTTSGLGVDAPADTTWISTPTTVIAGGLEYEKHATSNGAIWLLESNGMTADFHPQTNNTAYLDLSSSDGTPIFRVEKSDSFLVGVHVENVSVDGNTLVCYVPVLSQEHPYVRVKASLSDVSWAKEEDGIPSSLATVTWTGSAGAWTCRITNNTSGSSFFAQMEYMQEGGTKIVNNAPMDVSKGIMCTDGIHKTRAVYNNGVITWEVVP